MVDVFTPRKLTIITNQVSFFPLASHLPPKLVVKRLPAHSWRQEIDSISSLVPYELNDYLQISVSPSLKWGPSLRVALGLWTNKGHYICYSSVVHGPAASTSPGSSLDMHDLGPVPELLNQNLHFSLDP